MEENGVVEPLPLAGRELAALAGVAHPIQWQALFECVNVLDRWPGKAGGKGDAFPMGDALEAVDHRLAPLCWNRRVVLLGRRVERAFRFNECPWFEWHRGRNDGLFVTVPHPSHVNHWWNKAENRREAARFWGTVADMAREGLGVML
jgi:hypothetical protein